MNDSENLPNQLERWRFYPPLGLGTYIVIFLVIVLTLIVGTLGNTLVIFLFIKYKSLRTTPNILLLNLTGASLLMCVLCLPNLIVRCIVDLSKYPRPIQEFVCNGNAFSGAFVGFSGILSLTALAIDRYIVISRHAAGRRSGSKSFSFCSIVLIFLISFTSALAPVLGFGKFVQDGSEIFCTFDFFTRSFNNIMYNVFIQIMFFAIPLVIIVTCYTRIYLTVREHERTYFQARQGMLRDDSALRRMCKERKHVKTEVRIAKVTVISVSVFCISWFPYSMVALIGLFGDSKGINRTVTTIPAVFAKVSTVLNPLIYVLLQKTFKNKVSFLVRKSFKSFTKASTSEHSKTNKIACDQNTEL